MSRTPNVCGATRAVNTANYDAYETTLTRGPRPLGGPLFGAKGLRYDPHDYSKCFRVYVHRAWAPGTYWLALMHASSHWSSWPCIVDGDGLKAAIDRWDPEGQIRWAPLSETMQWDWPKLRHYGSKGFKPRNTVTYAKGLCLAAVRQDDTFSILLRRYPHTLNVMNFAHEATRVDLLSCRPLDSLDVLREFADVMGPRYAKQAVPEASFIPQNQTDYLDRLSRFFTPWSAAEVLKANPNNVTLSLAEVSRAVPDEDREVETIKARLKLAQEQASTEGPDEDEEDEPPTSEEDSGPLEDLG